MKGIWETVSKDWTVCMFLQNVRNLFDHHRGIPDMDSHEYLKTYTDMFVLLAKD
jgi:hypothetical protein